MKTRLLPGTLLVIIIAIVSSVAIVSCASSPKETWPSIEPSSFIGTRWVAAPGVPFNSSLEIINETECYYTIGNNRYHTKYTLKNNVITIPAFHDSWELKGDILYNRKGAPVFIKA